MPARPRERFVVDPGPVGARVRRIRTDRGIPVDGITAVPRSTLEQIEAGRGLPSLDTAIRLADTFGVTLDHLIGRELTAAVTVSGCSPTTTVGLPPGLSPTGDPAQTAHALRAHAGSTQPAAHAGSSPATEALHSLGSTVAGLRGAPPALSVHR